MNFRPTWSIVSGQPRLHREIVSQTNKKPWGKNKRKKREKGMFKLVVVRFSFRNLLTLKRTMKNMKSFVHMTFVF